MCRMVRKEVPIAMCSPVFVAFRNSVTRNMSVFAAAPLQSIYKM